MSTPTPPNLDPDGIDQRTRKLWEDMKAGKVPGGLVNPLLGGKVPTVYKHIIKVEWFRKFTWRERLMIAFGYNLVVMEGIATQHNPGVWQPLIMGRVTLEHTAGDHMKHVIESMIIEDIPVQKKEPKK